MKISWQSFGLGAGFVLVPSWAFLAWMAVREWRWERCQRRILWRESEEALARGDFVEHYRSVEGQ